MSEKTAQKIKAELARQSDAPKERTLKETIEDQRAEIERSLPNKMDADRFARIVVTTVRQSPGLERCTKTSVLAGCMLAAQLGLEPGPLGFSYLVPFKNKAKGGVQEAQFILGYKGVIQLARRSGDIKDIQARTVFEDDVFEHEYGLEPRLIHRPNHDSESKPRLYYLITRFLSGGEYVMVAPPWKIEDHRLRSKAADTGPWKSDYEQMAWKTLVQMSKPWLPLTIEANQALQLDGAVVNEISKDMVEEQAAQREFIDVESSEVDEEAQPASTTEPEKDASPAANDDDPGRPFT
jgi:recombination protein RecT